MFFILTVKGTVSGHKIIASKLRGSLCILTVTALAHYYLLCEDPDRFETLNLHYVSSSEYWVQRLIHVHIMR